ncbi:O-methyltransferase family protein [Prunus dulcis]|uniref:O-methyltransferase family protein n=1 Tax=Prunus dulcis TaxID=3755 RepID=A0A5H2XUA9_PRUDU|nr:O-methyltransferase family protein [Prunus dulcis]
MGGEENNGVSENLRWLAVGPSMAVPSYRSYLINGVKFNIKSQDDVRTIQNSGVYLLAHNMQVASANDKNPIVSNIGFYGVIQDNVSDMGLVYSSTVTTYTITGGPIKAQGGTVASPITEKAIVDAAYCREEKAVVVYSLTPASRLLLKEAPLSTTQFLLMILDPVVTDPFHLRGTWCQMNNHGNHDHPASPFEMAHGRPFWGLAAQQPKFGSLFNEAMEADSQLIARAVVEECEGVFDGLNSLVDVGGGTGTMAKGIAKAFPNINCNHMLSQTCKGLTIWILLEETFGKIWILHDWSDEESVKILKKSREAILAKMKEERLSSGHKCLMWDMLMMVDLSGKERSEAEWEKLFLTAGFSHYKITHTLGLRSLIEVYP